jgi:hypothetical protein
MLSVKHSPILLACAFLAAISVGRSEVPAQTAAAGEQVKNAKESKETTQDVYATPAAIKAIPTTRAKFTRKLSEFAGEFTGPDGKTLVLGGPRAEQRVWHFVAAMREGQTYDLPESFLNFIAAPGYVTATEIAAMPPCTAMIAARSPCSASLRTADGKWFYLGDPGSGLQISQFIWCLEDGQLNRFPDAFIAFQGAPRYATAKEITDMPPRVATLVHGWDDSAYFKTADGKGFFVGSEHSGKEVAAFLASLEEGKAYDLPAAFVRSERQR